MPEAIVTRILRLSGYRVYQHVFDEAAQTVTCWVRPVATRPYCCCPGCGSAPKRRWETRRSVGCGSPLGPGRSGWWWRCRPWPAGAVAGTASASRSWPEGALYPAPRSGGRTGMPRRPGPTGGRPLGPGGGDGAADGPADAAVLGGGPAPGAPPPTRVDEIFLGKRPSSSRW